jgi:hypothetical protein
LVADTDIIQNGNNAADVTVDTTLGGVGDLWLASSVSISATGAVVSAGFSGINADFTRSTIGAGLVQQDATNTGIVTGTGTITFDAGTSVGDAASVSIGASGSSASLSIRGVGDINFSIPDIQGQGAQDVSNAAAVTATGTITGTAVDLSGNGASAGVSASGASASFMTLGLGAASFGGQTFGDETTLAAQIVSNDGAATGEADVSNTGSTISLAALSGDAASASIGAKGASASSSMTTIATTAASGNELGPLTQTVSNATTDGGAISVSGGSISITGDMLGLSSSASISASGAQASYSISSIADSAFTITETLDASLVTADASIVNQQVTNGATGTVTIDNTNSITLGGTLGIAASASISAVGAGSFVNFSAAGPAIVVP